MEDVVRNGNAGIGKPEPVKHDFAGYWYLRTTDAHRLVYEFTGSEIRIASCRYHDGRSAPVPSLRRSSPVRRRSEPDPPHTRELRGGTPSRRRRSR